MEILIGGPPQISQKIPLISHYIIHFQQGFSAAVADLVRMVSITLKELQPFLPLLPAPISDDKATFNFFVIASSPPPPPVKPQDLMLIRKFVRRTKGRNHQIANGQIFEAAQNLVPYLVFPQESSNFLDFQELFFGLFSF